MSDIIKETYELSVWDRKNSQNENFLMIIGSSSMTTPYRAINPIVKSNVNGERTLTFTLYTRYFDSDIGEFVDNPFINYLHNETLLKLHRGTVPEEGWDEFIIKDIQENSEAKSFTYTAKRAWAIELGKTGYGLLFNTELMNNTGTAVELAEKVFEGTDWQVQVGDSDKFWGAKTEPVYQATLKVNPSNITCIREANIGDYNLYYKEVQSANYPEAGNVIYIPYSSYQNLSETGELQFLWNPSGIYEIDNEGLIYTANSYIWVNTSLSNLDDVEIDLTKKGDLLQNKDKTVYLKNIDRVVTEGKIITKNESGQITEEEDAYRFIETSYLTNDTVQELIVNGRNFESTNGWRAIETGTSVSLDYETLDFSEIIATDYTAKLVLQNSTNSKKYIYNAAIRSNISVLNNLSNKSKGIAKGDKFVLESDKVLTVILAEYSTSIINGVTTLSFNDSIFQTTTIANDKQTVICEKGASYSDLINKDYGLFIEIPENTTITLNYLSFYKHVPYDDDVITPSTIPNSTTRNEDVYIKKSDITDEVTSLKDVVTYNLETNQTFVPNKYGSEYEKISSIDVAKSNRFNALQEICEAFECWADLVVEHNSNGFVTSKKVILKNFIGDNKHVGFSYGLNLKSINRQLVSDQIVTKLIVEQNNNENAQNGTCSIIRAKDNKPKTNFIYDFSYYINQNVLLEDDIRSDFYGEGLLKEIGEKNEEILSLNQQLQELESQRFACEKDAAAAKEIRDAAIVEIERLSANFKDRTGIVYNSSDLGSLDSKFKEDNTIKQIIYSINIQSKLRDNQNNIYITNNNKAETLKGIIKDTQNTIDSLLLLVNNFINEFETKYATFIQEGTWSDESYFDDDLYFYDANNILHTSAFPKVSYTINVIDVSPLAEEYAPFKFRIGDKTYVEDTEFFGWNQSDSTPFREEVVISQMEEYLDSPEQNKVTVQNYKTQFEDLFQRIAATTQSLQYSAGAYQRAANKITATNELDLTTLQNSLLAGVLNLQNMGNLSLSWTEKGLIVSSTDSSLSHKKMRLSNTGLDLSVDGGLTWRTAITGSGIIADEITAGSLNANKISIKSGDAATFIWDAKGLRAYETIWNESSEVSDVNFNNYIEFNDKGLIAYRNKENGIINKPFELTAEGNLTLSGSLKVAVLEYGKVQAIGGIVLIRPSSLIKKAEYDEANNQTKIWVETPSQFSAGDWCVIGSSLNEIIDEDDNVINAKPYKITEIIGDTELVFEGNVVSEITGKPTGDLTNLALVSIIEDTETPQENNVGIAINSSTNEAFSNARSLSIFESKVLDDTWVRNTRLLLGELPEDIVEDYKDSLEFPEGKSTTYGLYAENAIITGHINAKSGSFTGLIEAGEGHIGGWIIDNQYLASYKNETDIDSDAAFYISSARYSGTNTDLTNNWIYCRDTNGAVTFKVGKDGCLTATGARVNGAIIATNNFTQNQLGILIYSTPEEWYNATKGSSEKPFSELNFFQQKSKEEEFSRTRLSQIKTLGSNLTEGIVSIGNFVNSTQIGRLTPLGLFFDGGNLLTNYSLNNFSFQDYYIDEEDNIITKNANISFATDGSNNTTGKLSIETEEFILDSGTRDGNSLIENTIWANSVLGLTLNSSIKNETTETSAILSLISVFGQSGIGVNYENASYDFSIGANVGNCGGAGFSFSIPTTSGTEESEFMIFPSTSEITRSGVVFNGFNGIGFVLNGSTLADNKKNTSVSLLIGSDGTSHGVYSDTQEKWLIYANGTGEVGFQLPVKFEQDIKGPIKTIEGSIWARGEQNAGNEFQCGVRGATEPSPKIYMYMTNTRDQQNLGITYQKYNGTQGAFLVITNDLVWLNVDKAYVSQLTESKLLKITSTGSANHLEFSRAGTNYIIFPGGTNAGIGFQSKDLGIGTTNTALLIKKDSVCSPGNLPLGSATYPWQSITLSDGSSKGIFFMDSGTNARREMFEFYQDENNEDIIRIGYGLWKKRVDLPRQSGKTYICASGEIRLYVSNRYDGVDHTSYVSFTAPDSADYTTFLAYLRPSVDNKITLGTSPLRWAQLYVRSSTIETSDEREKENIFFLNNNTEKTSRTFSRTINTDELYSQFFDKLAPAYYNFLGDNKISFGLIAQQIVSALNELGISEDELDLISHDFWIDEETGEQKDRYGLRYSHFIPLLIHEVQKLKKRVSELENLQFN